MDDTLKTSQQKRGEHHLPEGHGDSPAISSDSEGEGSDIKTTSGKLSLPEGD